MRSGSLLKIITARSFAAGTIAPVDSLATLNEFDNLSWAEDATLVNSESGFLHIDFPEAEFTHIVGPTKPARPAAKLLHGRSPLGLAMPIVAEDLEPAVALPARVLQLISDEHNAARPLTCHPASAGTFASGEPPRAVRIISPRRAYKTEMPLMQSMMKPFDKLVQFYWRRIMEILMRIILAHLAFLQQLAQLQLQQQQQLQLQQASAAVSA